MSCNYNPPPTAILGRDNEAADGNARGMHRLVIRRATRLFGLRSRTQLLEGALDLGPTLSDLPVAATAGASTVERHYVALPRATAVPWNRLIRELSRSSRVGLVGQRVLAVAARPAGIEVGILRSNCRSLEVLYRGAEARRGIPKALANSSAASGVGALNASGLSGPILGRMR